MHEITLSQRALEIIEQQAQQAGARRVTGVWLKVGAFSCVEASALTFCFELVCRGTLAEGCELLQTLTYTRCEHVVTRRVTAPAELYGKTLDEVAALYPEWRITEFGASLIKMEQQPDMFCPDHMVLMPNGAGVLCVFQNKYGDGLALVNELDLELSALPSAIQEDLRHGMGFSTLAELEQWLESVES